MWDDNDPDEYDYETSDDDSDFDDSDTVPCPSCGEAVYEDSERCPYCGDYITFSTSPLSGRPTWWIVLGLIGIVAVVVALSGIL